MRSKFLTAVVLTSAMTGAVTRAQTYSNTVATFSPQPVAYWPLTESVQPPFGYYVATNLGTGGAAANGYYQTWYQPIGNTFYGTNYILKMPGPVGGQDWAMMCNYSAGSGQYLVLPRRTNGAANPATTIAAPFTIEAWPMSTNLTVGLRPIVTQGRNSIQGDASIGYNNAFAGFGLGQYQGFFYFQLYNTNRNVNGGPELDMRVISPNV